MQTLVELDPSSFHRAAPLFADLWDQASTGSVLSGQRPGWLYVDDPLHPTSGLLCHHYGNFFPVGAVHPALLQFICETPWEADTFNGPFFAYYITDPAWRDALMGAGGEGLKRIPRHALHRPPDPAPYRWWRQGCPPNIEIRRMDAALAEQCDRELNLFIGCSWEVRPTERHPEGGYRRFDRDGLGFVALHEGRVASVAWAFSTGPQATDLSIDTAEPFRRQGLATLVCSAFLEHCGEQGLTAEWVTDIDNDASMATARTLGFHLVATPDLLIWRDYGQPFRPSHGLWQSHPIPEGRRWTRVER